MSLTQNTAPAGGEALPISHTPAGDGPLSAREAARSLADARYKREAEQNRQAEPAPDAPPPSPELSAEDNAAPPVEAPGGTVETEPAVEEQPPIEPPRSWTKEEKAEFATYPREAQEKIARREQERERSVRQSQNEAAEKLKGLTAKEQAVEQARQQYESALPILMQNLQSAMAGEFSDIQTMADVQRMANDDFPRYVRWDAQQKQLAAVQQEITSAQTRQAKDKQQKLLDFMKTESEKFAEIVPEIADETQRTKLQSAAVSVLKDIGFKDEELGAFWNGEKDVSIHDHRFQLLIRDAVKFREAQKQASAVKAKPLPPVQRPGVAKPAGTDKATQIQALEQQLSKSSGLTAIRLAADITKLRRAG